jgi:hypothetical protein
MSARALPVYGGPDTLEFQAEFASDRKYQIKQPNPAWSLAAEDNLPGGQEQLL